MSDKKDGPSDEEVRLAQREAQKAAETAKAMAPYVEANRLNPMILKRVLDHHAPGNEAEDDGIFDQRWISSDTFYNNTLDYVPAEQRPAYKSALDKAFPKRGGS